MLAEICTWNYWRMWIIRKQAFWFSDGRKPQISPCLRHFVDDPSQYHCPIGLLIYLTITRPDLSYAVHISSQFMQEPKHEHLEAAKHVWRYLKATAGYGILPHSDCNLQVHAYGDVDWGACPLTRRLVTGHLVIIGGSPVLWKTKKKITVFR